MAEFDPSSFLDIGDVPGAKSGGGDDIARMKINQEKEKQDPLAPFKGAPSKAFKKGTALGQQPALDQHGEIRKPAVTAKKEEAIEKDKARLAKIKLHNDYLRKNRLRQKLEEGNYACKPLPFDAAEHLVDHCLQEIDDVLSGSTADKFAYELVGFGNLAVEKMLPEMGRHTAIATEKGPIILPGLSDMFVGACNDPSSNLGADMEEISLRLEPWCPGKNYMTRFLWDYLTFVREVYKLKSSKKGSVVNSGSPEDQQAQEEEAQNLQREFAGL